MKIDRIDMRILSYWREFVSNAMHAQIIRHPIMIDSIDCTDS